MNSPNNNPWQSLLYPDKGLQSNYCRNPDPKTFHGIMCYTTSRQVQWAYCDVDCPHCRDGIQNPGEDGVDCGGHCEETFPDDPQYKCNP